MDARHEDAIRGLQAFLDAGRAYENRGGKHDPLDADIATVLELIPCISCEGSRKSWASGPSKPPECPDCDGTGTCAGER